MNENKIYLIDENCKIIAGAKRWYDRVIASIIDEIVMGIIFAICAIIIGTIIKIEFPYFVLLFFISVMITYFLIILIVGFRKYNLFITNVHNICILKNANFFVIFEVYGQFNNFTKDIFLDTTEINNTNVVDALVKLKILNEVTSNQDNNFSEVIKNTAANITPLEYKNVKFLNESRYYYYFIGDFTKKNGEVIINKKFRIAKLYTDMESLKAVDKYEK